MLSLDLSNALRSYLLGYVILNLLNPKRPCNYRLLNLETVALLWIRLLLDLVLVCFVLEFDQLLSRTQLFISLKARFDWTETLGCLCSFVSLETSRRLIRRVWSVLSIRLHHLYRVLSWISLRLAGIVFTSFHFFFHVLASIWMHNENLLGNFSFRHHLHCCLSRCVFCLKDCFFLPLPCLILRLSVLILDVQHFLNDLRSFLLNKALFVELGVRLGFTI